MCMSQWHPGPAVVCTNPDMRVVGSAQYGYRDGYSGWVYRWGTTRAPVNLLLALSRTAPDSDRRERALPAGEGGPEAAVGDPFANQS